MCRFASDILESIHDSSCIAPPSPYAFVERLKKENKIFLEKEKCDV